MEPALFNGLFKDLMNHLYDFPTLEAHPLSMLVDHLPDRQLNRGEFLRQVIFEEIERMQVPEVKPAPGALEWRPYYILHKRYAEGTPLKELASFLSLSERQLRRDHNRALQLLANRVWERIFGSGTQEDSNATQPAALLQTFELHLEPVDLNALLQGIIQVLSRRLDAEGIDLTLEIPAAPISLYTDRIVLRQVLISLINIAIHLRSGSPVRITVLAGDLHPLAEVAFEVDENWSDDLPEDLLETARYWGKQVQTAIEVSLPEPRRPGKAVLTARLPAHVRGIVLVVDDQEPSLRLYQRFVSRTPFQVVGTSDPTQVLTLAKSLHPVLITLDVMMPRIDGWELLQSLQLDQQTSHIPVVICSAWEEPELARSLGAAEFLKKPVMQKDFLSLLEKYAGRLEL